MTPEQLKQQKSELEQELQALKAELISASEDTNEDTKKQLEKEIAEATSKLAETEQQLAQAQREQATEITGETTQVAVEAVYNAVEQQKTSTTELLRGTETERRLLNILKAPEFAKYGDSPEKRLETIFGKIHTTIENFLISKFAIDKTKETIPPTITEVITPAIERYLMDFLKKNQHENNVADLTLANGISFETFTGLFSSVANFAGKATATYGKGKALLQAIDFLSIHKESLLKANQSDILRNPLKCKEFLENPIRNTQQNIYSLSLAEVGISFGDEQPFGLSETDKQEVKDLIGEIEIVESPATTKLILGLVEKAEPFFDKTAVLANQAMDLMDQTEGSLGMFKSLGIDIFKTINESKFLKGVLNFVLSLLGFTGGFEGLQKRWYSRRIDRQLDDQKRSQISSIFQEYLRQTNTSPIAEENKLTSILKQKITFPPNTEQLFNIDQPALKSSISEKITNPADLNPAVIRAVAGGSYLTTTSEEVEQIKNGKTKTVKVKKETVNAEKFNKDKEKIIPKYLEYMTKQLAGNADYLQNIDSADTVAFTMISSLFVQPDHVIDGIKAKVFLPEAFVEGNYQPRVEQPTIPNTPTAFVDNFTEAKKAVLTQELQAVSSPLTAEMIVQSAQKSAIPVAYLTAVIKNDSSYGTTGVGARTNNPGNVGNTDNGNTRNFPSREAGLDAAAGVIKSRIDAYKTAYPTETGIPPLKNLLENRGPDGKGFLPTQTNYQQDNPYRTDAAPLGAYMTAENGPEMVSKISEDLNTKFLA